MNAYVITADTIATMADPQGYGLILGGAIAVSDGAITWVGPLADLPAHLAALPRRDCGARTITQPRPGLTCRSPQVV